MLRVGFLLALATAAHSFTCDDGVALSDDFVNDSYCDCADGSDEPGTAACASLGVRFFCANRGFRSQYVRASVVNDGVCDCCDGSDEHASGRCKNDCVEAGASARKEAEARVGIVSAGLETAKQWSSQHAASKSQWAGEIEALKASKEEKQKVVDEIAEEKKVAEVK